MRDVSRAALRLRPCRADDGARLPDRRHDRPARGAPVLQPSAADDRAAGDPCLDRPRRGHRAQRRARSGGRRGLRRVPRAAERQDHAGAARRSPRLAQPRRCEHVRPCLSLGAARGERRDAVADESRRARAGRDRVDVPGPRRASVSRPPDELARAEHRPSPPGRPCRAAALTRDGQGLGPDARGPASRLGGAVAGADRDRRRRSALAGDHRREPLLPAHLGPSCVDREHVAVRPRLLAELPLLPRPRDVGHRDLRRAAAAARRTRIGEGHPRVPRPAISRPPG